MKVFIDGERVGEWTVLSDGSTTGSPVNSVLVSESMKFYMRQKKVVGYKRDLPFRYSHMATLWSSKEKNGPKRLISCYVMAVNYV